MTFFIQRKSAVGGTITAGDAALLTTLVTLERVIVTVLVMEVSMMVMRAVEEIWCVAQTTASSLEHTSIPRMTAARILMVAEVCILILYMYIIRKFFLLFVSRGHFLCVSELHSVP